MKRSRLGPGRKALERGSSFASEGEGLKRERPLKRTGLSRRDLPRTSRKPTEAEVPQLVADKAVWRKHTRRQRCAMCGSATNVTGHHIIPLRVLKTMKVPPAYWFDLRNHLPLCMDPSPQRCHDRHELWVRRVPRELLAARAPRVAEFAAEVGLVWVLDREYPPSRT